MRGKRPSVDKLTDKTVMQGKAKHNSSIKGSGFTKHKTSKTNKENIIQITEPLDPAPHSQQSKEYIPSRQSLARTSRGNLKDINVDHNAATVSGVGMRTGLIQKQYQQQMFDRRLSLKCVNSQSQQFDTQKSQRLSMMPLRRQSLGGYSGIGPILHEERDSLCSTYSASVTSCQYPRPEVRKEMIISNLVHKLEREDDLRSIIESKLKHGQPIARERKNPSHLSDYTQQIGSYSMPDKIKHYEHEIRQFKSVIRQLSTKINQPHSGRQRQQDSQSLTGQLLALFKNMGKCGCSKQRRTVGTQTETKKQEASGGNQFMDNLQRTLEALK